MSNHLADLPVSMWVRLEFEPFENIRFIKSTQLIKYTKYKCSCMQAVRSVRSKNLLDSPAEMNKASQIYKKSKDNDGNIVWSLNVWLLHLNM